MKRIRAWVAKYAFKALLWGLETDAKHFQLAIKNLQGR